MRNDAVIRAACKIFRQVTKSIAVYVPIMLYCTFASGAGVPFQKCAVCVPEDACNSSRAKTRKRRDNPPGTQNQMASMPGSASRDWFQVPRRSVYYKPPTPRRRPIFGWPRRSRDRRGEPAFGYRTLTDLDLNQYGYNGSTARWLAGEKAAVDPAAGQGPAGGWAHGEGWV